MPLNYSLWSAKTLRLPPFWQTDGKSAIFAYLTAGFQIYALELARREFAYYFTVPPRLLAQM